MVSAIEAVEREDASRANAAAGIKSVEELRASLPRLRTSPVERTRETPVEAALTSSGENAEAESETKFEPDATWPPLPEDMPSDDDDDEEDGDDGTDANGEKEEKEVTTSTTTPAVTTGDDEDATANAVRASIDAAVTHVEVELQDAAEDVDETVDATAVKVTSADVDATEPNAPETCTATDGPIPSSEPSTLRSSQGGMTTGGRSSMRSSASSKGLRASLKKRRGRARRIIAAIAERTKRASLATSTNTSTKVNANAEGADPGADTAVTQTHPGEASQARRRERAARRVEARAAMRQARAAAYASRRAEKPGGIKPSIGVKPSRPIDSNRPAIGGKTNEALMHELLIDPDWRLAKSRTHPADSTGKPAPISESENSVEARVREQMERAFWAQAVESMSTIRDGDCALDVNRPLALVAELRSELRSLCPEHVRGAAEVVALDSLRDDAIAPALRTAAKDPEGAGAVLGEALRGVVAMIRRFESPSASNDASRRADEIVKGLTEKTDAAVVASRRGDFKSAAKSMAQAVVDSLRFCFTELRVVQRDCGNAALPRCRRWPREPRASGGRGTGSPSAGTYPSPPHTSTRKDGRRWTSTPPSQRARYRGHARGSPETYHSRTPPTPRCPSCQTPTTGDEITG